MSTTTGSAERLQRAAGGWRLEFEQLVYNAPAILRPRRFAVAGEHAILQQLREFGGHEPLVKDAERLFARGALPDGTYIAREGRWLPELRPDAVMPDPEPDSENEAAAKLGAGLVDELNRRIASLEATVKGLQKLLDGAMRAVNELNHQRPAAAPVATSTPSTTADPIATTAAAILAPKPVAAAAPRPIVDPNAKVIALPTASALSDLIKSLAGPEAMLNTSEPVDWAKLASTLPAYYATIKDHDGHDVGAMLLDIESALRLAGALLMESEDMTQSLLDENMMSDDMLDAASEVCNTLMSAFNKIAGNPHLRVAKLELLTESGAAWIAEARKCDDYHYTHGGRVAMAVR